MPSLKKLNKFNSFLQNKATISSILQLMRYGDLRKFTTKSGHANNRIRSGFQTIVRDK
jgi:hypothetical protein